MLKHDGIGGLRVLGGQPPSGGCVLKQLGVDFFDLLLVQPPSGGCVLKLQCSSSLSLVKTSRLQAAVC